jgi:hypothetical protein
MTCVPPTDASATPSVHWDHLLWAGARWTVGGVQGEAARIELRDATLFVSGLRPVAAQIGELMVEGLRLQTTLGPAELLATTRRHAAAPAPVLDALRHAEGRLQAFVTDAAWILDATVTVPIHQGRIDFDEVDVDHLGPDSSMGLSAGGLYLDAPLQQLGRRFLYLFTAALPAGLQVEQRQGGGVADRGAVDLPVLLAALLQAPRSPGRWANDDAQRAALSRSRIAGELELGDGLLQVGDATLGAGLRFSGQAQGANRVALSSPALDESVTLRVPQLSAEALQAQAGGWRAGCERIEGQFTLQMEGDWPGGQPLRLTLEAPRLGLRGLRAQAASR